MATRCRRAEDSSGPYTGRSGQEAPNLPEGTPERDYLPFDTGNIHFETARNGSAGNFASGTTRPHASPHTYDTTPPRPSRLPPRLPPHARFADTPHIFTLRRRFHSVFFAILAIMTLDALSYFFNGMSLAFFVIAAIHAALCARRSGSRPHYLFAVCLAWMALIEIKELFISFSPTYQYEVLGPGFTFPDLFTLPLLSLFFFELVMPGRITVRYAARLLAPFVLLAGAYCAGLAFQPREVYYSFGELLGALPSYLPLMLLLYVLYTIVYCIFALARIVTYSLRYADQIAQAYSFTERIHLRWMRWMSAVLACYLICYIGIITFTSTAPYIIFTFLMTLGVWGILYGCIIQYRIPEIIHNYWQEESAVPDADDESPTEKCGRIAALRQQVAAAIDERRLYLDPGLTIVDLATECGTNRTHLSRFFNSELGIPFRDYINRCRVEHATRLMAGNDHKIEELALLAGFGSTTTFYRAFAKEKKMTPQQWLDSHKGQQPVTGEPCISELAAPRERK